MELGMGSWKGDIVVMRKGIIPEDEVINMRGSDVELMNFAVKK